MMIEPTIQESAKFSMDEKVKIELAIEDWQEAVNQFDQAEERLHEARVALAKLLPSNKKFIVRMARGWDVEYEYFEYEYFLVTTLDDGAFSVAPIDCLWQ